MNTWLSLITSLPTENATVRMRAWRALKTSGAAVLRDGVYLMPERATCKTTLEGLAADVRAGGGMAWVIRMEEPDGADFMALFERSTEYTALLAEIVQARDGLSKDSLQESVKQTRKLRKSFTNLAEIDFFPRQHHAQTAHLLSELEQACVRLALPDEPHPVDGEITPLALVDFQGRVWATRQRPWVDRLASAWLIVRFIDPQARFCWLACPQDCPPDALGFDFDGANFSHVGNRVTFEVLLGSFELQQAPLRRMAQLVHYLDVGGIETAEAAGVESILAGMRAAINDDDQLLASSFAVFDGLLTNFTQLTQGGLPDAN